MKGYGPSTYGDICHDLYDATHSFMDPGPCVAFLAPLAGTGPALELGVGTGRVAIPLAAEGVAVVGVDASKKMTAAMRRKPGGRAVRVVHGDFGKLAITGEFPLVYCVFNTFFSLLTQAEQCACFARVAERLAPGGAFVLECFVPDLARFDRGQRMSAHAVSLDGLAFEATMHDPLGQVLSKQEIVVQRGRLRTYPVVIRYAWPSELDLMARLAGLRLRERWGGWDRAPFRGTGVHVSVYERG